MLASPPHLIIASPLVVTESEPLSLETGGQGRRGAVPHMIVEHDSLTHLLVLVLLDPLGRAYLPVPASPRLSKYTAPSV